MSQNPYGQGDFADELAGATAAQRAQAQVQQILAERAAERAARAIGGDTAPDTVFQPAQPEQTQPEPAQPEQPAQRPAPAKPAAQRAAAAAAPPPATASAPVARKTAAAPPSLTPPVTEAPPAAKKAGGGQVPQPATDTVLLDANTLAALLVGDHVHHQVVADWYASSGSRYATCPFTENSLVRLLVRTKHSASEVGWLLVRLTGDARHEFWADALPFSSVPLTAVVGHRQVTDAYLVALARHRGARLLSLDKGLHALHPDVVELLEVTEAV